MPLLYTERSRASSADSPSGRANLVEAFLCNHSAHAAGSGEALLDPFEAGALAETQRLEDAAAEREGAVIDVVERWVGRALLVPGDMASLPRSSTTFEASQRPPFGKTLITPSQSSCASEAVDPERLRVSRRGDSLSPYVTRNAGVDHRERHAKRSGRPEQSSFPSSRVPDPHAEAFPITDVRLDLLAEVRDAQDDDVLEAALGELSPAASR